MNMLSKKQFNFLISAKKQALQSKHGKIRIGAVLVKNKIISKSSNGFEKTHPLQKKYTSTYRSNIHPDKCKHIIHAELQCIIKSKIKPYEDNSDLTMYIVRVNKNNEIVNSRPCDGCIEILKTFNIRKIFYNIDSKLTFEDLSR